MHTIGTNWASGGIWNLTQTAKTDMKTSMLNAFSMSVRQQTYYAYMSTLFQVGLPQQNDNQPGQGIPTDAQWFCCITYHTTPSNTQFGDIKTFIADGGISTMYNSNNAGPNCGNPPEVCLGNGQRYQPLAAAGVFDGASGPTNLVVFNFSKNWNGAPASTGASNHEGGLHGAGYDNSVSLGLMQDITSQPGEIQDKSDVQGGFYPPTFWFQAFPIQTFACPESGDATSVNLERSGTWYQWLSQ